MAEADISVPGARAEFAAQIFYPATAPGAPAVLRSGAPYPLIVFSPGFDIVPSAYDPLVDTWASAGFIVAVAHYPSTAPGDPGGLDESDIVNHPADMHAVIDTVLALSHASSGLLAGMVDPGRIGAAGHSDGGDVTDAAIANSCCRDPRIAAAAVLAGAELTSFRGGYTAVPIPLLVVQGDSDPVNAPACSQQIYAGAAGPRFYLDLRGARHRSPYLAPGFFTAPGAQAAIYRAAVDQASILFWEAFLGGDAGARRQLDSWRPPDPAAATLYAGTPVVGAPGGCEGAPG